MSKNNEIIPIFFAVDDSFASSLVIALTSLIKNASLKYNYRIYVMCTDISKEHQEAILSLQTRNVEINFTDVSKYLLAISDKLPIRDYYSKTTYYRLFIADMFPEYDKAIYLDSDLIVLGDISDFYHHDIGDNILGATQEAIMTLPETKRYSEEVLGVPHEQYFNAGVLLINIEEFRKHQILDQFASLLNEYNFVVAQDQDYLNVICKDHVKILKKIWNVETMLPMVEDESDYRILHYIMANKPWHYEDAPFAEYFWNYAKMTPYYDEMKAACDAYTDEERKKDEKVIPCINEQCNREAENKNNFYQKRLAKRNAERVRILHLIEEYEREGKFDVDVEKDPPSRMLMENEVDYLQKKFSSKLKSKFAFSIARIYLNRIIKKKQLIVKDIIGLENVANLNSGAVITCNHFSPMDSFAIQLAYQRIGAKKGKFKKRKFFRVIREGNFTTFPGFYGFLMRHCDTLPLSSNFKTMKKFISSTDQILKRGDFVLFYPEQSMWWNYRKPKPLKRGAFTFASNNRVPVIPVFITMQDSIEYKDQDGFPVQELTIHIGKPIAPDPDYSTSDNAERMMVQNYRYWKAVYEETYQRELTYTTKKEIIEEHEVLSRFR